MIHDTCPHCGAGVLVADGRPCRSEKRVVYRCRTIIDAERDTRRWQSTTCKLREPEFLRARVRELEAVVTDPEALWANWLRGTVRLPSGIGDVRAQDARVRELEERNKRLVEAGDELLRDNDDMAIINRWWRAKEAKP